MTRDKTTTILVVDDDVKDNKALTLLLTPEGYTLDIVTSGKSALEYLKTGRPDLILLDIIMPGIDGFELCEQIKADPKVSDIPVIFLSARYDYKDVVRGFELGAVDYITKPFNSLELTSRIRSQLTLRYAQQRLHMMNQSKDKLFSVLSHDLRNPLISFQSGLRLLYKHTPEKSDEWLQIYDHLTSVSSSTFHLLNTVLDWSKTQMSTIEQNPAEHDLKELVDKVLQLYLGTADLCNLELINNITSQTVYVDKEMFSIILRNLVSNAVKFSDSGGEIHISSTTDDRSKNISVSDSGVGMSSELLEKVMSFDSLDLNVKSSDEFSLGFGLSLCKEYVKKIGGEIFAKSRPGEGSKFTFTIPLNNKI